MLNRATIMGRLTRDPELKTTQSGISVVSFSVAVDRNYKGQDGEKQADFIGCTAWRNTADFISKYFSKGNMIIVDGRLTSSSYKDKEGNNRSKLEITVDNVYFGESKKRSDNKDSSGEEIVEYPEETGNFEEVNDEEELPF